MEREQLMRELAALIGRHAAWLSREDFEDACSAAANGYFEAVPNGQIIEAFKAELAAGSAVALVCPPEPGGR
ncbi:hypothetical protein [Dokdonella sp.]|uniref:hypothetical protein n=1 Tax=Dokdonella sp. TaxID=2291710 RepID=UPI002D801612|nr:hypothetical protein [Dokdonella sp.]